MFFRQFPPVVKHPKWVDQGHLTFRYSGSLIRYNEEYMKTKWIIGTLGVLLVTSFAGNAWLGATLGAYRYNVSHGWFAYCTLLRTRHAFR